jgi:hypothetical protein
VGRVRLIFELPSNLKKLYPHKLAYVDWFTPFGPRPVKHLGLYTTSLSVNQAQKQQSGVIPLSSIRLACHLGPKYSSIDKEVRLTNDIDIFKVCPTFYFNEFGNYFTFDLMEHWNQEC